MSAETCGRESVECRGELEAHRFCCKPAGHSTLRKLPRIDGEIEEVPIKSDCDYQLADGEQLPDGWGEP